VVKFPSGKVYIGSDELGYELKLEVKAETESKGFLVVDLGCFDIVDPVDSLVLAREVAEKVLENEDACDPTEPVSTIHGCKSVGIVIDKSGVGILTAVAKMSGIVPALCTTVEMAANAKQKSVNLLCIGLDTVTTDVAKLIISEFLSE
jgi:ribose 5-phosphate isomerase RpiB